MIAPKHILGTFDEALASLRNNVLMMAGLTERSLDRAMKGLFQRDDDLCANAIADDEEIDQLEKQIDKDGVDILLRFQPEMELIVPMHAQAMSMFKDSLDAYVREDVELGRAIVPRDEKLDELNRVASRRLIRRMAEDPDQLRGYLNLMFIARHLERVGDHATNIAEDAVYAAAAEDIRHQPFVASS
jgi:phosphate transport system protein